jgi:ankyrin repeat protein
MTHATRIAFALILGALVLFTAWPARTVQAEANPEAKPTIASELAAAIRNGDRQAIAKSLAGGADVNARDAAGNTPLVLAALYAGPDCVALLLERGADANAANRAGATALHRAATDYDKARLLLAAGAKPSARTAGLGNTPLLLAARCAGNSRTVKLLLDAGADAQERNALGASAIMAAAAAGDSQTVELLLDQGADPNDFPELKNPAAGLATGLRTPLMWAAYRNDVPMIRLLLKRGADANKVIAFGTPLTQAAWHDSLEATEALIASGAQVDVKDPFAGFTPLHWAAGTESPRAELVKFLLARGADPNAQGGEHIGAFGLTPQTPRLIAERRGRTAIVEALIAAGAKQPPAAEGFSAPQRKLPEKLDDATLVAAAEEAVAALQATASRSRESFLKHVSQQDCTSCHQQYLPMAAVGHVRGRSVLIDETAAREQTALIFNVKELPFQEEFLAQSLFHPEPAYGFGYELLGLAAEKVPPSFSTDIRIHHLAAIQAADGRWFSNLPRPPLQSSDVGATALAIQALKNYGWPGREQEFDARIERAKAWLANVKAETNDEAIFQLLGLHWAGEAPEKLAPLAESLVAQQRADGGWAQLPALESDAYATAQALYALAHAAGFPSTDPAWQRGLRFLLAAQDERGAWRVARRAFPFQPTMESGFPHGRDSWISASATSWAVMALAHALPVGPASGKLAEAKPSPPAKTPPHVQRVDFAKQVKPLLERSCLACHSGERPRGLLRVDSLAALMKGGESGMAAISPGHSEQSLLVDYVSSQSAEAEMPPKAARDRFPKLSRDDVAVLRAWIDQGAEWPQGLALEPPESQRR